MNEIKCPECGSTQFTHPIEKTSWGYLTIDTEDETYLEFDDEDSKCALAEGNCTCAECNWVIGDGKMLEAIMAMFRDRI